MSDQLKLLRKSAFLAFRKFQETYLHVGEGRFDEQIVFHEYDISFFEETFQSVEDEADMLDQEMYNEDIYIKFSD